MTIFNWFKTHASLRNTVAFLGNAHNNLHKCIQTYKLRNWWMDKEWKFYNLSFFITFFLSFKYNKSALSLFALYTFTSSPLSLPTPFLICFLIQLLIWHYLWLRYYWVLVLMGVRSISLVNVVPDGKLMALLNGSYRFSYIHRYRCGFRGSGLHCFAIRKWAVTD